MGMAGAIAAAAGASIIGSAISADAAGNAASKQAQSANNALANQQGVWNQVQNYFKPYVNAGQSAIENYSNALPGIAGNISNIQAPQALNKFFSPTDLVQTPGYQFTLNQGLQATQNGFSAQGLNNSGAATKGAAQYAQGLASNTYNQQLQNYLAQQGQQYSQGLSNAQFGLGKQQALNNMLFNAAGLGQNAVTSLSGAGLGSAQQTNNLLTQLGNAQAAGIVGQANALGGGLNSLGSLASTYGILNGLNPQNPNYSNTNPLFNFSYGGGQPSNYMTFGGGQ
jgi:hypothetical protein